MVSTVFFPFIARDAAGVTAIRGSNYRCFHNICLCACPTQRNRVPRFSRHPASSSLLALSGAERLFRTNRLKVFSQFLPSGFRLRPMSSFRSASEFEFVEGPWTGSKESFRRSETTGV